MSIEHSTKILIWRFFYGSQAVIRFRVVVVVSKIHRLVGTIRRYNFIGKMGISGIYVDDGRKCCFKFIISVFLSPLILIRFDIPPSLPILPHCLMPLY